MRRLTGLAVLLLLAACGTGARWDHRPDQHIVRKGETLHAIAFRYGRDPRELSRWNRLGDGSLIHPGQVIRLTPPVGYRPPPAEPASRKSTPVPAGPPPVWSWPTSGRVVAEFGAKPGPGSGILIAGSRGQAIRAAAPGQVVYAGSGLAAYGQLIIIKHDETYLSAYGYNASLLVEEGQNIGKNQQIATMGEGPEQKPRLHFEIRRNGKPVSPRRFLPAR